jgi:hypothetical protein
MPEKNFRTGDFVRCTSTYYAQQLDIGGLTGIVMGTKPHHIHVWFESQKRSYWLSYDILRRVEEEDVSPLLSRIQLITYAVNAEEWELEETAEHYKLLCYVDEVSFETLLELRTYLDLDYQALSLGPEGMGRMIAQFTWIR